MYLHTLYANVTDYNNYGNDFLNINDFFMENVIFFFYFNFEIGANMLYILFHENLCYQKLGIKVFKLIVYKRADQNYKIETDQIFNEIVRVIIFTHI